MNMRRSITLNLKSKKKAIITDGLSSVAPLTNERCNYIAMIAYITI